MHPQIPFPTWETSADFLESCKDFPVNGPRGESAWVGIPFSTPGYLPVAVPEFLAFGLLENRSLNHRKNYL